MAAGSQLRHFWGSESESRSVGVAARRHHGGERVSAAGRGGRLESGSGQDPAEETAAVFRQQEEVGRGRVSGGSGGRSAASRRLLQL